MQQYKIMLDLLREQRGKYLVGLFLLGIANPLSNIAASILFIDVFDKAVYDASLIPAIIAKFSLLILVEATITPLGGYLVNFSALKTTARLREQVLRKLIRLDQTTLNKSHGGDLISRCTNDIQIAETAYKEQIQQVGQVLLNGVGCSLFMVILNWRFAVALMVYQMVMLLVATRFAKASKQASEEVQSALGKVTEKISDILSGFQVIRLFSIGEYIVDKFKLQNEHARNKSETKVRLNAAYRGVNNFAWSSSFVGFIAISTWFLARGDVSLGTIVALTQAQNGVTQLFTSLGTYIYQLQASMAGFDRIQELMRKKDEPQYYPLTGTEYCDDAALSLRNVSFHYEDGAKVINDLSLSIDRGETIAIVGPSGGGKSTLLKLILGFHYPQSGGISIMGKPASKYTLAEIRDLVAFVSQDPYLFSGTVRENILYGNPSATDEQVIAAAKQANAHEFIQGLGEGYDTVVGERGIFLSGGQKQRIAIARAILKDAEILLLDEATSALDNESEALVQTALDELMKEKTSIVIAHRLSTIEDADRILVMDQGEIAEQGTHQELLKQGGIYASLYSLQFREDQIA